MKSKTTAILGVIILVGAALRVAAAARADFWLDEVWSFDIAQSLRGPLDVIGAPQAHIDNNHPLDTLFIWMLGPDRTVFAYRSLSLASGIGSMVVLAIIARRRGEGVALLATALAALSFPLLLLGSEARGYAPACLFALLAFDAAERYLDRPRARHVIVYGLAVVLGMLAHLTFLFVLGGLVAWTLRAMLLDPKRGAARDVPLWQIVGLHAAPIAFVLWFFVRFVAHLVVGGADARSPAPAIVAAWAELFAPPLPLVAQIAIGVFAIGLLVGAIVVSRAVRSIGLFLLVTIVLMPALILGRQVWAIGAHQPILSRYFLVGLPFFILAVSTLLAPRIRKTWAAGIVGVFIGANVFQIVRFAPYGRGGYANAIRFIVEHSSDQERSIAVLVDHPLRTGRVARFYARPSQGIVRPGTTLTFRDPDEVRGAPPDWSIRSNLGEPPDFIDLNGNRYVRAADFPHYGPSGADWRLYQLVRGLAARRIDRASSAGAAAASLSQ